MSERISKEKLGVKVFGLQADTNSLKNFVTLDALVFPEDGELPLTYNFEKMPDSIIGKARVYKKEDGLYADLTIHPDKTIAGGNPSIRVMYDSEKTDVIVLEVSLTKGVNVDPEVKFVIFDIVED